jgi:deoxyguanosine kinase
MKHRYIVVEGPIGAGKTSLAVRLAERMNAATLLEDPKANPFLADLFGKPTVADFTLAKDPLFARLTLDDAEYQLYDKIHAHVKPQVPPPDLVIYLQASVDTLVSRVKRRGVPSEASIDEAYLRRLSEAYTSYFHHYEDSPLLIVNSERLNFVEVPEHLELLIARIEGMRGGREFFNRA